MTQRVLVTGAGGPAGVAVIRSLLRRSDLTVFAADMDGWASGIYLVPPAQRRLVPPGRDADFVPAIARMVAEDHLDLVISALDKLALAERCAATGRTPRTVLAGPDATAIDWEFPVFAKPRQGAGSRGVRLVPDRAALEALPTDEGLIVQDFLPGEEYSVDVIADASGAVIAAVPRTRARVDSGVAIAGRTVLDPELEDTAADIARAIGLVGVANVQLRRDRDGRAVLLEVNPRFPGALPLTIAAGVDIPSLVADLFLGREMPVRVPFREVASVRFLEDVIVEVEDLLVSEHAGHQEEL
jgi:carbamoyl-phosphate synthase large subunit